MSAQPASTETTTLNMLGRLLVGMMMSKPEAPRQLQKAAGILRNLLKDDARKFVEQMATAQEALLAACIDFAVSGIPSDRTKKMLTELPIPQRVVAEALIAKFTGRTHRSEGDWVQPLWRLKKMVDEIGEFSITPISKEGAASVIQELVLAALPVLRENFLRFVR